MNWQAYLRTMQNAPAGWPAGETPYFVISRDRILAAHDAFKTWFPSAAIHYAMKANSDRNVLRTLAEAGAGFEVASAYELRLLSELQVPADKILYGSSIKPASHIQECHEYGVDRFAADSPQEVDKIASAAPGARIYVRVRVDDSGSVFRFSEKFGVEVESVADILRHALKRGLRGYGISFHVGSQASNDDAWADALRSIGPVLAELWGEGIEIETLNIGGGYPCRYRSAPSAPSLQSIAAKVAAACASFPCQPKLILEPGRGIVGDAATLTTRVIARVDRKGTAWLFLDAGVYNALYEALSFQGCTGYEVTCGRASDNERVRFSLAGPTGDSHDVIARNILLPRETTVGDILIFHSVGAYSLSVASAFNGFPVPRVHFVEGDAAWSADRIPG
jgi:ornithine decarboxylase